MDHELNHIGLMQLFYVLKQLYPAVPDSVVTSCLRQVELNNYKRYSHKIECFYEGTISQNNFICYF